MDIMRPKLQRIANMCFRRLDIPNDGIIEDLNGEDFYRQEIQNIAQNEDNITKKDVPQIKSISELEERNEDIIEDISDGKGAQFRAQLPVKKYFHRFLIGFQGNVKKDLEYQSRCRISVPNQTDMTGVVVITGNTKPDVNYAINKISATVLKARNRSEFTHFVSIPFNDNSIIERYLNFKRQIYSDNKIEEKLFQNSNKLHVTIAPLLLTDENERNIASQILEECDNNFIKPLISGQSIQIKLEGIDYFNDDPTQVNVIYAKVVDISQTKCLQSIANYLFDKFKESGLICGSHKYEAVNPDIKVKLHVTLMNTKFAQKEGYGRGRDRGRNQNNTFDASIIMEKFKDYYFGEIDVKTIEISVRHSNRGQNGYYSHTSRIEL